MIALQIYLTAAIFISALAFIVTYNEVKATLPFRIMGSTFAGFAVAIPIGLVAAIWTLF